MAEWPGGAVPGQRQMDKREAAAADRSLERPRQVVHAQRAARRLVFLRLACLRDRRRRLCSAERGEQARHYLVRCGREQEIDGRKHLIVHAPAVMDLKIGTHVDNLWLRCFVSEYRPQAAAEIDPVEREDHIRLL